MRTFWQAQPENVDVPPGTPVYIGEHKDTPIKITIIDYDHDEYFEQVVPSIEACFPYKDTSTVTWINVDGLHDPSLIDQLGRAYGVHPLIIEDILNTTHRPKIDVFDDYIVIVFKMHTAAEHSDAMGIEQVSLILGRNFVLTFQEREGDVFEPLRSRLRSHRGRIRQANADYLAYALLDTLVDSYFNVLERLDDRIEAVEERLMGDPEQHTLRTIHILRRELIYFRNSARPLRNMVNELSRQESSLIEAATDIYFKDLYDHIIQILDTLEIFREMTTGMLDIYLSSTSNKMNEVMQFLTIIGTIFIPLTFIVGIYGMNFSYMPELGWKWGYFAVLGVMSGIGALLLGYFKKKNWL